MPHFVRSLLMGLASVWALLPSAHANLVVNGSFEDDLAGWSASGAVVVNGEDFPSDGVKAVVFNYGNVVPSGLISQSFPTVPGTQYTLEFDYWGWATPNLQRLGVQVAGNAVLITRVVTAYGSLPPVDYHTFRGHFVADSTVTTLTFKDLTPPKSTVASDLVLDRISVSEQDPHIAGTVDGYRPNDRLKVVCTNLSTGQSVLATAPAFDCGDAGLAMASGDKVRVIVNGIVR